jgi:hypothetical protein
MAFRIAVRVVLATTVVVCFPPDPALAQRPVIEVSVGRVEKSFHLEPSGYGVFGPTDRITLPITVRNDEEIGVPVTLRAGFFTSTSISIIGRVGRVPSQAEWQLEARCGGAAASQACTTMTDVFLPPNSFVEATVSLTALDDQHLGIGDYEIVLDVQDARTRIVNATNGKAFTGVTGPLRRPIRLAIQAVPSTTSGLKLFYHYEIEGARHRRDHAAALALYQRMVALDPADLGSYAGMGTVLVELGRYAEAVIALERVLPTPGRGESLTPEVLAVAYVGLGRDAEAEDLLRRTRPASAIPALMANARARVARQRQGR